MKYITKAENAPEPGPYSLATISGNFVFTSGQVALAPDKKLVGETVTQQTHRVMANLQAILREAGCGLDNVVKVDASLADMCLFGEFNDAYGLYFLDQKPARQCVVAAPPIPGALVEMSMIAELPAAVASTWNIESC